MDTGEGAPRTTAVRPARIDAHVLGAGTAPRFAVLLLLLLASTVSLLAEVWSGWFGRGGNRAELCLLASGIDPTGRRDGNLAATLAAQSRIADCLAGQNAALQRWLLAGAGALLVLGFAHYYWYPAWRGRGGRLLPLDGSAGGLGAELDALARAAGLARLPRFVLDPAARTASAVTFGRLGRYTVCLHGGLVARRATDPAGFRAVVLHELAHIRNRDVDVTYATVALWRLFLILAVLPYLVATAAPSLGHGPLSASLTTWRESWPYAVRGLVRLAVLVTIAYLARADILRTRETYADVDATMWGAEPAGWSRAAAPAPATARWAARWAEFRGLWRAHPGWADRARSVVDPSRLFAAGALPMFLTGVVVTLTADQVRLLSAAAGRIGWTVQTSLAWLMAALVTGIAGTALWRAAAHAVLTAAPAPSWLRSGLWLGIGLAAGELLTFRAPGTQWLPRRPEPVLILVLAAVLLTAWITQCAELWIRTSRGRTLRWTHLVGLLATLAVFGELFTYWTAYSTVLTSGMLHLSRSAILGQLSVGPFPAAWTGMVSAFLPGFPYAVTLVIRPLVFIGATVLWLFPLAAWVRRPAAGPPGRPRTSGPDASGPGTSGGPVLPPARGILWPALLGGAASWLAAALVMLGLHRFQPPAAGRGAAWVIIYQTWAVVAIVLTLAVAAAVTAALTPHYQVPATLAAAGGMVLVGLAGQFLLAATDGCLGPLNVMSSTCRWHGQGAWQAVALRIPFVLGLGMYVALMGAAVGAALARTAVLVTAWARRGQGAGSRPGAVPVVPHGPAAVPVVPPDPHGPAAAPVRPSTTAGPVRRRAAAVVAVGAAALVLGAVSGQRYWHAPAGTLDPTTLLSQAPQQQQDLHAASVAVGAWAAVTGGQQLITDIGADLLAFNHEVTAAIAESHRGRTVTIDRFQPICAALRAHTDRAVGALPIPDPDTQRIWASVLDHARRGSEGCLSAFRARQGTLFDAALPEFEALARSQLTLRARLDELAAA